MKKLISCIALSGVLLCGCSYLREHKDEIHQAIITYAEQEGQKELIAYIDKLVEEGKLGKANADRIKAAIPYGLTEMKRVMGEIENEEVL